MCGFGKDVCNVLGPRSFCQQFMILDLMLLGLCHNLQLCKISGYGDENRGDTLDALDYSLTM